MAGVLFGGATGAKNSRFSGSAGGVGQLHIWDIVVRTGMKIALKFPYMSGRINIQILQSRKRAGIS